MKSKLIEPFRKALVNEDAKTPDEAKSEGLALVKGNARGGSIYILYDAKYLIKLTRKFLEQDPLAGALDYEYSISQLDPGKYIVGVIRTAKANNPCWNAWQVDFSAARSGYGPLIYDIALSDHDLIPDRTNVSDEAGVVWEKYYKMRKDVEKKPLDDIEDPKTPSPEDDCEVYGHKDRFWLDYAYDKKTAVNVSGLYQNHNTFMSAVKSIFEALGVKKYFKKEAVEKIITNGAHAYFIDRFAT